MCWQIDENRSWVFALGSLLVHAGAVACLFDIAPRRSGLQVADAHENVIHLEIIQLAASSAKSNQHPDLSEGRASPKHVRSAPARNIVAAPPRPARATPARVNVSAEAPAALVAPPDSFSAMAPASPMLASAERRSHGQSTQLDLSARSVARAWNEAAEAVVPDCKPGERDCDSAQDIVSGQELEDFLRQIASSQHYLTQRRPPRLQRQSDGGYRYHGQLFSARINREGTVDFVDGVAARKHPRRTRELNSAEKRWFLSKTEELRRQLAESARAEGRMQARRSLESELAHIVATKPATTASMHARFLTLWQEATVEDDTASARRIVEAFVRAHLPQASALGFTDSELADFNRGRSKDQAFQPYARDRLDGQVFGAQP